MSQFEEAAQASGPTAASDGHLWWGQAGLHVLQAPGLRGHPGVLLGGDPSCSSGETTSCSRGAGEDGETQRFVRGHCIAPPKIDMNCRVPRGCSLKRIDLQGCHFSCFSGFPDFYLSVQCKFEIKCPLNFALL